jgi:hypothetical protein
LAALAATAHNLRLRHLLLWDPVVDGRAYLQELIEQHRSYMREEMGPRWNDDLRLSPEGFPLEVMGVPVPPAFAAQLRDVDLASGHVRADHVTVITTAQSPGAVRLEARLAKLRGALWQPMSSSAWNSDSALNAVTVPIEIVQALVARIEETIP